MDVETTLGKMITSDGLPKELRRSHTGAADPNVGMEWNSGTRKATL